MDSRPGDSPARRCLDWFLGKNVLGSPLYDYQTGGCHDGLHEDRVNQNEGAESTLAWLLSLQTMRSLECDGNSGADRIVEEDSYQHLELKAVS